MKRTYVYDKESRRLREVETYRSPKRADGALWNDRSYDGLRATDGSDISSRRKHRDYMKRHGLTTADDFSGEWKSAKKRREAYYERGGSVSKRDIAAAMDFLNSTRR